jgi:diguanylate cyclase (GGDEF)-like protein
MAIIYPGSQTSGMRIVNEKLKAVSIGTALRDEHSLKHENRALKARIAELERLVIGDTLTPLYNRRHFMTELDRWCSRAHRYGGDYALIFIDVDNLKAVNDDHGHPVGDALLVNIAKTLLASVRKSDIVARVGGDEFAILLDNIAPGEVPAKTDHLVKAVSGISFDCEGIILRPSISAGYAIIETGAKPSDLLHRADRSMYEAKKAKARYVTNS